MHHRSHIDWPIVELESQQRPETNCLSHGILCAFVCEVICLDSVFSSQLLVQAEVHPHRQYVNVPDPKPSSIISPPAASADSPPNTVNTISAHTNNTSPSLAEATVSDNESFTIHSSGLPTPDTPLLLYSPLLDEETCSTSSTTNTPDYDLKLTPSPATPGSTKYHRLGEPSVSASPTPTSALTPNLEHENSYESMLSHASKCGGTRYENVPGPITSVDMTDIISHSNGISPRDSKYVNIMSPLQTGAKILAEDTSPVLLKSENTTGYENLPSRGTDCDVYESIAEEKQRLEDTVSYEPVNIPQCQDNCVHLELTSECKEQHMYQNVPKSSCGDEEHLYEDVQVRLF